MELTRLRRTTRERGTTHALTVHVVADAADRRDLRELREFRELYAAGSPAAVPAPVWDGYDEEALLLLCRDGDRPVGALRLTRHWAERGELLPYFHELPEVLRADPVGFANIGRVLLAPTHRASADVAAALFHAGGTWCARTTPLRRYASAVLPSVVRFHRLFGARVSHGPVPAPGIRDGLVLMTGGLRATAEATAGWLTTRRWALVDTAPPTPPDLWQRP
ncbi:hypothetical protein [Streptomyces sp. WAC06614]|uniref:N-acyl amino acid synthase FeeM domain-containing protein n=1 Tax=Streptomyces sp. WAC06614 TaxID=2487416 RepID=UPI000F7A377A|nr:hypothetical protein [Streptomyces sp. WAC06614]RSS60690.1 hypothetical protein EF918_32685 [Streptomyces sp. WAC06614]